MENTNANSEVEILRQERNAFRELFVQQQKNGEILKEKLDKLEKNSEADKKLIREYEKENEKINEFLVDSNRKCGAAEEELKTEKQKYFRLEDHLKQTEESLNKRRSQHDTLFTDWKRQREQREKLSIELAKVQNNLREISFKFEKANETISEKDKEIEKCLELVSVSQQKEKETEEKAILWVESQFENDRLYMEQRERQILEQDCQIDVLATALWKHHNFRDRSAERLGEWARNTLNEVELRLKLDEAFEREKNRLESVISTHLEEIRVLKDKLKAIEDKQAAEETLQEKENAYINDLEDKSEILDDALEENKKLQKKCKKQRAVLIKQDNLIEDAEKIMKAQAKVIVECKNEVDLKEKEIEELKKSLRKVEIGVSSGDQDLSNLCNLDGDKDAVGNSSSSVLVVPLGNPRPFQCYTCPKTFGGLGPLKQHVAKTHDMPGTLDHFVRGCKSCGEKFESVELYKNHSCNKIYQGSLNADFMDTGDECASQIPVSQIPTSYSILSEALQLANVLPPMETTEFATIGPELIDLTGSPSPVSELSSANKGFGMDMLME